MLKMFNPKFALLSLCATTCLVGFAQAAESTKSKPDFTIIPPDIHKIACGSDGSEATYTVINNTGNPNITLLDIEIIIDEHDTYPDRDLVDIKGGTCVIGKYTGNECTIILEINTQSIACPVQSHTRIDRTLEIDVNTWTHDFYAPIDLDVTTLGILDEFLLLAPSIFNKTHHNPPHKAQVYDNAAYTDDNGFGTTLIDYIEPNTGMHFPWEDITKAANEDLEAVFYSLLNMQYDGKCTYIDPSLGDDGWITPGTYCFSDRYPATIKGTLNLSGGAPYIFIVDFDNTDKDDIVFNILEHAHVVLHNGAKANDIFWIVKGSVEMQGRQLIGNVFSTGAFEFEHHEEHGYYPSVIGRVMVLGNERYASTENTEVKDVAKPKDDDMNPDCEHERPYICLSGSNFIMEPDK